MSRIEEIDKIVDEIGDTDSLYEFAECVYEDRQRIAELEEQLKNAIVLPIEIGDKCWTINCWCEYGDAKKENLILLQGMNFTKTLLVDMTFIRV